MRADLSPPSAGRPQSLAILAICVAVSGAAGLVYEVVWSRYLGLLIGSSTVAHTLVLAAFMGGLALGNAVFGRFADRTGRPLFAYGLLELGIAAWAGVFALGWPAVSALYLAVGRTLGPESGGLPWVKLALGAALLLPPTVLMGGTIPLLSRVVVARDEEMGAGVALLYFLNTAGAVLGCAAAGFWWIEAHGLAGTLGIAALLNTVVGAVALALAPRGPALEATDAEITHGFAQTNLPVDEASEQHQRGAARGTTSDLGLHADAPAGGVPPVTAPTLRRAVLVCIAVTGGLTMVYELVWIRMVGFIFGSSSQSFSVMLVTFLGGIALGGAAAQGLLRRPRPRQTLVAVFGACELGVAISVLAMLPFYERFPYVFATARTLFAPTDGGYASMQLLLVALLAAVMLVPTTLIGVTLPLAARIAVDGLDDVGAGVGASFAVNTVGTLLGAALTGLVFIPLAGVQASLLGAIAGSAGVGGVLLLVGGWRRTAVASPAAVAAALAVIVVTGGAWDPVLMTAGYFRGKKAPESFDAMKERYAGHRLLFARDGNDATVTVVDVDGDIFLKVNGKTDASTLREDMVTQTISGHLPLLLHSGNPRDVLVIGLGSGVTAGAALAHPAARVTSVELSRAVVDGARHFAVQNRGVLDDPRHALLVADAKDYVHLTPRRFDVVISEPSNPWISGVASLFTVEFFRAIRGVMNPDGVYLQWLQLYAFTDEAFSRSLRSLRAVFPHVTVWRFTRADCLLVASREPLSTEHLEGRLGEVAPLFGAEAPLPIDSPAALLAHQVLSSEAVSSAFAPVPPLNLDAAPFLGFEAPRAMFRRTSPGIVDDLDERRDPGAAQRLMIASVPAAAPQTLADAVERAGRPLLAEHIRVAARLDVAVTDADLDAALAAGDPLPALLRAMDGPATAAQCRAWSGRLAAVAIESRNALFRPPLTRLTQFVTTCIDAHPALGPTLRDYLGKALFATGRPAEAAPLLAAP